jgi:hypothetical protein
MPMLHPSASRRRFGCRTAGLLAASVLATSVLATSLLAGCAGVFGPRQIEVSESQLQQQIAKRFPYNNRYLELFDVTVSAPRVKLLADANRVATLVDITATDRLTRKPLKGSLDMNYALRFEPSDNSIRFAQVRVERFGIDGAPEVLQGQVNRLGALIAEQLLDDHVLHTLKPDDVKTAEGRGYKPGELKVTPRGIVLTLEPVK